ncbi:MAG: ABC transporter permease [Gammaproteobacteria bacterium]
MTSTVQYIPYSKLILATIPVSIVVIVLYRWSLGWGNALYALGRMTAQLLLVGYVLVYIFRADNAWIVLSVLALMIFVSGWIALQTVENRRRKLYRKAIGSILVGGASTLLLITQGVLSLKPWYLPQYMIPLAGMVFAGVMNSVSLAAERLVAETERGLDYRSARPIALKAALIPITNSLFAVGLVALPGMMTGQILSGVSPLIAANYQIMVMLMIFGSAGLASICFLALVKNDFRGSKS